MAHRLVVKVFISCFDRLSCFKLSCGLESRQFRYLGQVNKHRYHGWREGSKRWLWEILTYMYLAYGRTTRGACCCYATCECSFLGNSIALPTAPTGEGYDDSWGHRNILERNGHHEDDQGDTESEFGENYHYNIPRETRYGIPMERDQFGRFPRDHHQMEPREGVEDRIVRAAEWFRDFGIRVKVEDFKGHFNLDEFSDWI